MRILVALSGNALQRRDVEQAAGALATLAAEHEVIVTHDSSPRIGHMLELALRNRLPERDVVGVLTQVVVNGEDPEPNAIAEVRSLRVLVDSGALVICAGGGVPIALNGDGTMHEVEAAIDKDLTVALLARRLDADLLLMLAEGSIEPKVEAARRFAAITGRRAAIGRLDEVDRVVQGEAGTQIVAPVIEPAIAAHRRLA
jgi:carbamate kinase